MFYGFSRFLESLNRICHDFKCLDMDAFGDIP